MAKLGLGVLGAGRMGRRHAENLRSLVPEARLVAVADADVEAAHRLADDLEIEHYYDGVKALVERNDTDAVVIASPSKVSFIRGSDSRCCRQAHPLRKTASPQAAAVSAAMLFLVVGCGIALWRTTRFS